jgi:hypothetical protein
MILSVPDHPLELETPVDALARDMSVGVYVYNVDPVLLRERGTVRDLSFDRLIRLARALGISGVNDPGHEIASSSAILDFFNETEKELTVGESVAEGAMSFRYCDSIKSA